MTLQKLFIMNLKDYRKLQGFSQLKLAEKCNSSQAYIAEIEVGKKFPSLDMIERIASALNIESYYLFKNEAIKNGRGEKRLSPSQKQEIAAKIGSAVSKTLALY